MMKQESSNRDIEIQHPKHRIKHFSTIKPKKTNKFTSSYDLASNH